MDAWRGQSWYPDKGSVHSRGIWGTHLENPRREASCDLYGADRFLDFLRQRPSSLLILLG
jgi:hypothetical protein